MPEVQNLEEKGLILHFLSQKWMRAKYLLDSAWNIGRASGAPWGTGTRVGSDLDDWPGRAYPRWTTYSVQTDLNISFILFLQF